MFTKREKSNVRVFGRVRAIRAESRGPTSASSEYWSEGAGRMPIMVGEFLPSVLAQGVIAAQSANEVGLPPRESLTLSLTAESLLFAAFTVSFNMAQPTKKGRHPFFAQGVFSFVIVAAITAVAVAAGAAWWATFEPNWPTGINQWLRAGGVAVPIVLQPFLALAIAIQARNS